MKTFTRALAFTLILAATLTARAADRIYAVVSYMHIPEGSNQEDYLGLEKLWQRLHQKAVDSGFCRGWYLDRVENGGRNQFVTVEIYDSLDKVAARWPDSMRAGLYNSEEMAKMRRTGEFRDLTRSEIWEIEASAMGSDPVMIRVDFMKVKPGKASDYYALERDIYQKIHKARIDAGEMNAWWLVSRVFPSGTDSEYDFVTLNAFPEKLDKWTPPSKFAEKVLTAEERAKASTIFDMRTAVRHEIWRPVLHTDPAKK